jgi:peptidoglycan glycosyltransferase
MNRSLRRVAIAVLIMFLALLVNANVVQVGQADSLKHNSLNFQRVLYSEYSHRRGGPIPAARPTPR